MHRINEVKAIAKRHLERGKKACETSKGGLLQNEWGQSPWNIMRTEIGKK